MALPASRDVTFTPLAPVPSAFLNDVQDAIIADHILMVATNAAEATNTASVAAITVALLTANGSIIGINARLASPRWVSPASGWSEDVGQWIPDSSGGLRFVVERTTSAAHAFTMGMPTIAGETLLAWSVDWANTDGVETLNAFLVHAAIGTALTSGDVLVDSMSLAPSSGRTVTTKTFSHTVVAGAYHIAVCANSTGGSSGTHRVYGAAIHA